MGMIRLSIDDTAWKYAERISWWNDEIVRLNFVIANSSNKGHVLQSHRMKKSLLLKKVMLEQHYMCLTADSSALKAAVILGRYPKESQLPPLV